MEITSNPEKETYKMLPLLGRILSFWTTHKKYRLFSTSIPSYQGSSGTAVVVGPRALVEQHRLLPDAVTQQPTGSQSAGAPSAPSRHGVEAELAPPGSSGSAKPRPLSKKTSARRAHWELPQVGRAGASRPRLLMNNARSGRCPGPGSGVAESPQWLSC